MAEPTLPLSRLYARAGETPTGLRRPPALLCLCEAAWREWWRAAPAEKDTPILETPYQLLEVDFGSVPSGG